MEHTIDTTHGSRKLSMAGIDTAFVLFFLALEYGRAVRLFSLDGTLMAITMVMVLVLPYFLPTTNTELSFGRWLVYRTSVLVLGLVAGALFTVSLGVIVPPTLKYLPMTLLVLSGMISCYVQFYSLLRLRLAK